MICPAALLSDRDLQMAVDVAAVCGEAAASSAPQTYFVALSVLFSLYIGVDMIIAAMVVRRKMSQHARLQQ